MNFVDRPLPPLNIKRDSEYDHFIAILENGDYIIRDHFEELQDIIRKNKIKPLCRLKAEYRYTHRGVDKITHWFQYHYLDPSGFEGHYSFGYFSIVFIDEDKGDENFISRNVIIRDNKNNQNYTYKSVFPAPGFFLEELVPLLKKLNKYGSWEDFYLADGKISPHGEKEVFQLYKEVTRLRRTLEFSAIQRKKVEDMIAEYEEKIKDLKKQQEELEKERENFENIKEEYKKKEENKLKELDKLIYEKSARREIKYGDHEINTDLKSLLYTRDNLIKERNDFIKEQNKLIRERDKLIKKKDDLSQKYLQLQQSIKPTEDQCAELKETVLSLQKKQNELQAIMNSKYKLLKQLFK